MDDDNWWWMMMMEDDGRKQLAKNEKNIGDHLGTLVGGTNCPQQNKSDLGYDFFRPKKKT